MHTVASVSAGRRSVQKKKEIVIKYHILGIPHKTLILIKAVHFLLKKVFMIQS